MNQVLTVAVPTNKFVPSTMEFTGPSGRKYVLRELTGYEAMQAEAGCADASQVIYSRAAMAIVSVDGEKIAPHATRATLDLLLKSLPDTDMMALIVEYTSWISSKAKEVKNESAPSD